MADDRKIIVAVDFGTTYSGLAWAQTRKPEIQMPVIQWPDGTSSGLEGATSDKVPTEIQYEGQSYKWGFQIAEFGQRHQWFKLNLDPTNCTTALSVLARDFPDPNAAPPEYNHDAEKLVTDYLTALRIHAKEVLKYKLPESAIASTPIEFVITTPAVWSDLAKAKTKACAQKAGMGSGSALHIISEPEAAAIYALDAMDPHNIKVGDTFVLCDAGGGTVDLISYKVVALKPTLQIAEAAPGSGSTCGSTFLNRIFGKFLKDKFGSDPCWDDDVLEEALKRFETTVKRAFGGAASDEYQIPVPGLRDSVINDVRRGRYRLTGADVNKIFEPVVKEVVSLVLGQITATKASVKAVLMVGGFGQSPFLRDSIRQSVAPLGIEVMQSPNGWTAVVRGALMKGLADANAYLPKINVSARIARKHYGLEIGVPYDANLHAGFVNRRHWDDYEGKWMIFTMKWFVKKGDVVRENDPHRIKLYNTWPCSGGPPSSIECTIMMHLDPYNKGARLINDRHVRDLVVVTADFSHLKPSLFPTKLGHDGQLHYELDYQVEITHYSAYTKYELIYNGVNYGPIKAEYV